MAPTAPCIDTATIAVRDAVALGDYFSGLGGTASVVADDLVRVELPVDDASGTIAEHLRRWVAANGVTATMTFEPPPAPPEPPEAEPRPAPTIFLERPRLGDLLVRKGLITGEQLKAALEESAASGDLLGRVMIRRQFIFEDELARTLAAQLDVPYVNLHNAGFDRAVAALLPSSEGMRIAALPIAVLGGRVRVVFADPSDESAKAVVREHIGEYMLAVADLSAIEFAWRTIDPTCSPVARVA